MSRRVPADRRRDRRARGADGPRSRAARNRRRPAADEPGVLAGTPGQGTAPSIADPAQRAELALAAARIRAVIDELERARRPSSVRPCRSALPEEPEARRARRRAAPGATVDGRSHPPDLGLALLGIGVVLALFCSTSSLHRVPREPQPRALLPAFERRLATGTFGDPTAPVPSGPVALLQIRRSACTRSWSRAAPRRIWAGPGHLPGSPLPGEFGNSVILGHNRLDGGPFGGSFAHRATALAVTRGGSGTTSSRWSPSPRVTRM